MRLEGIMTSLKKICLKCDNEVKDNYNLCEIHLSTQSIQRKIYYYNHKQQGLCINCNAPSLVNHVRCEKHNDEHRAYMMKQNHERRQLGLCIKCNSPMNDSPYASHCVTCYEKKRISQKKSYHKQTTIKKQQRKEEMEGFISITEAAKQLNVSRQYVHSLCKQNKILGANKINNTWKIPTPIRKRY